MSKLIQIIKKHKEAIILAVLTAVIISYPQIYFRYNAGYRGIDFNQAEDENCYWARIQDIRDGHLFVANAYIKEGKDAPYSHPPGADILAAYLGKIFSLNLNNTILFNRIFFVILLFLTIYSFVFLLFKEKLTAIAASIMVFLGDTLLKPEGILKFLQVKALTTAFLHFSRLLNPLISSFFFFSFLCIIWLFLKQKKWYWGGVVSILLGLSFYIYPYTWSFLCAFCGILILIFLFQKNWLKAKKVALILFLSFLMAIPFFINLYQSSLHPNFLDFQQRYGLVENRKPLFGYLAPLLLIIFLLFFPKNNKERFWFSLALVIAPLIVLNQQLITGIRLQPGHYHWYYTIPLSLIFFVIIFLNKLSEWRLEKIKKIATFILVGAAIYNGILVQSTYYAIREETYLGYQRYASIFQWLNKNTQKEEVVFSDPELSEFIPIHTSLNVLYCRSAIYYLPITKERLEDYEFLIYRLRGLGPEEVKEMFFKDRKQISSHIYGLYYRDIAGSTEAIPDEILLELSQKYQDSFSVSTDKFFRKTLRKYQVDYVIWDKNFYPEWDLDKYPFLQEIYQKENIKIYKLH